MSNVLKQRLDRGTVVTIMPCYEVSYRICRYFFSCGAHVLNLRTRSSISAYCGREARALRAGDVLFMFLIGEESRMIQMQLGGARRTLQKMRPRSWTWSFAFNLALAMGCGQRAIQSETWRYLL